MVQSMLTNQHDSHGVKWHTIGNSSWSPRPTVHPGLQTSTLPLLENWPLFTTLRFSTVSYEDYMLIGSINHIEPITKSVRKNSFM